MCFFSAHYNLWAQTNQTVVNGSAVSPVTFPATGCVYNWVNSNPGIGLPASGTGNISSFTAVNNTNSPITATITATPVASGFAYIANAGSNNISVIDIAVNTVIATIPVGVAPTNVSVSSNGSRVYVSNQGSASVSVIDPATNTVISTIPVGSGPGGLMGTPRGDKLYVANSNDGTVSVIKTSGNTVQSIIPVGMQPAGLVVSPDGSRVYVTNYGDGTVSVISTASDIVIGTISIGVHPVGIAISPDGNQLYVSNGSNYLSIVNALTYAVAAKIQLDITYQIDPTGVAASPDGKFVYVADSHGYSVAIIAVNAQAIYSFARLTNSSPYGLEVSPDNSKVYVVNNEGFVSVVDVANATSSSPVSASVRVGNNPQSFGNFLLNGPVCNGTPVTFTITVNPSPNAKPPAITATNATGNISACVGTASVSPDIKQFAVSGSGLTGNIMATAPPGFEVSLTAAGGFANSVLLNQSVGSVSNVVVYVRSAAAAPAGNISGNVALTSAGAVTQNVTVAGTVNALPTIMPVSNQTLTSGTVTMGITFAGTANTFTWVNDTPGIGLAASGTGNIPAFTTANKGSSVVTATITATPQSSGLAYIASDNNTVSVVNTLTSSVIATIPVGKNPVGVSVSGDGSRVYITNSLSNTVSVINTATNVVIATLPVGINPFGISVSPDGSRAYVANTISNTVSVINTATNMVTATIPVDLFPIGISVSPDGSRVYVANANANSISVINTATQAVTATIKVGSEPYGISFSPDGSRAYVSNSRENTVSVINTATNLVTATIAVGTYPTGISVSPDGTRVYVANLQSSNISVINAITNMVTASIAGATPIGVSVSADGSLVYVTNEGSGDVSAISTVSNAVVSTCPIGKVADSFGNFLTPGVSCSGIATKFTITVNPAPVSPPAIIATVATGIISTCAGTASASTDIRQFTVSASNLTGDITATAPAGFEVSLAPASGFAGSVVLNQSGGTVSNIVVYVRLAATAPAGKVSGDVVLTSPGAVMQDVVIDGRVNRLPLINNVANQTVTSGTATTAIGFSGSASIINWVNDTPGIGLAANGSGDIPSFTAISTSNKPVTATVTATPASSEFAYVANINLNTISVIDLQTNKVQSTITVGFHPYGLSVSPDGSRMYVTNNGSNTVSVINIVNNSVITTIDVGQNPYGLSESPDGSRLYVTNGNSNTVSVINTATNLVIATIGVGRNPRDVSVSPDGNTLYVANYYDGTISVINLITHMISTIAVGTSPDAVSVSPDGSRIYVANYFSSNVSVINAVTNAVIATIAVSPNPAGVVVSPDGSHVYVVNTSSNTVSVINTATNTVVAKIPVGQQPFGVSVNADGSRIYVTSTNDGTVSVINTTTNAIITTMTSGLYPSSFGNFVTGGKACGGSPVTFTITVNPAPTIVAGPVTGAISACAGIASASPDIQQFTILGANLTQNITVTAPANFEISLSANSGYNNKIFLIQNAGTVNKVIMYVRSAASAPAGKLSGNVTLASVGVVTQTVLVNGTVNLPPVINAVANQTVKNGALTNAVNFTGTVTAISWVNDTPAIGLSANGTGDIPSFAAVNTGGTPLKATITANANEGGCLAVPVTFTITVIPNNLVYNIVVPNTFTPNGDGINDTWVIEKLNTFPNCTVDVYNRYGEKVYSSIGYGTPWDGKHRGAKLPVSTYYYIINLKNGGKILSGWITIIR
ncbi:MAG TPA: beta-propeller fold lactonase family protein [Mucilaginibacter sp.]|nr:beta-propeller fold lactonase family protein [Mucilaginibacter sp.]